MAPTCFPRARSGAALRALAVLGAALLAACDRAPTPVDGGAPPAASSVRIDCRADVRAGVLRCGEAQAPGGARAVIVGGQGTFLRLTSGGTAYDDSAQVLRSDVTVRNLLAQAMGTTTGADTAGVRVFFAQGPVVTAGTGAVEVANPDGVGSFTGGAQPYFHYREILAPQGTSLPRRWEFSVPPTVETFTFSVLVQAPLHDEGAPLRWTRLIPGAPFEGFVYDAWSAGAETFAVGDAGLVLRHDGATWTRMPVPSAQALRGVWAASQRAAWAVGASGTALRFDGNRWTATDPGTRNALYGVWGASENDVFAVGQRGTVVRWIDSFWGHYTNVTRADLGGVWGSSAFNVFAVGTRVDTLPGTTETRQRGVVVRFDGVDWTESLVSADEEYRLSHVAGRLPDEVYAAGQWRASPSQPWVGVVLRRDVAGWTRVGIVGTRVVSLWVGPGEILAADQAGAVLRLPSGGAEETLPSQGFALASVFRLPSGTLMVGGHRALYRRETGAWVSETAPVDLPDFTGVWAADASNAFAVGSDVVARWDGASWTAESIAPHSSLLLQAVWGRAANDVYAVGQRYPAPSVSHWNGSSWSTRLVGMATAANEESLNGVHGAADGSTFAAGGRRTALNAYDGIVRRRNPADESWPVVATVPGVQLMGVWAGSASDVWAVGRRLDPATLFQTAYVVKVDGASPTPVVLAQYGMALDLWGSSPTSLYAVGLHWSFPLQRWVGVVWRYDGTAWSVAAEAGADQILTDVWGSAPDNVYAVGYGGAVLHFNGATWSTVDTGSGNILEGVHVLSRGDVFVSAWSGEVLRGRR